MGCKIYIEKGFETVALAPKNRIYNDKKLAIKTKRLLLYFSSKKSFTAIKKVARHFGTVLNFDNENLLKEKYSNIHIQKL